MIIKSFLIWLAIIPLAFLNGVLREMVINPIIGAEYGHPISCFSLCLFIFIICLFSIPRIGRGTAKTYLTIGLCWMLLTILFESCLELQSGNTFAGVIKTYDISTGNLWLLVVLFVGIAPRLTAKMKKLELTDKEIKESSKKSSEERINRLIEVAKANRK